MSNMNAEVALALALDGRLARFDDDTATLVAVADAVRALPDPVIDPVFATALEQRLLTEGLEFAPTGRPVLRVVTDEPAAPITITPDVIITFPRRRVAVRRSIVALAAAISMSALPVLASFSALPGGPLYGVKQKLHALELALFGGAAADASRHLDFAAEHIHEAEILVALGASEDRVSTALDLATSEIAKAEATIATVSDQAELTAFAEDAADTKDLLEKSAPTLSPEAEDAFQRVIDASASLTDAVNDALGIEPAPTVIQTALSAAETADATVPEHVDAHVEADAAADPPTKQPKDDDSSSNQPPTDDDPGDDDTGTGKTVRDAKSNSCSVPGEYEIDLILGSFTNDMCESIATD